MGPDAITSDSEATKDDDEVDNNEYKAESILDCRLIPQQRQRRLKATIQQQLDISTDPNDYEFLVKWKGYPLHDATWEPYINLKNAPIILGDFITSKCLPDHWRIPTTASSDSNINE